MQAAASLAQVSTVACPCSWPSRAVIHAVIHAVIRTAAAGAILDRRIGRDVSVRCFDCFTMRAWLSGAAESARAPCEMG
jgi:hypothetical protein